MVRRRPMDRVGVGGRHDRPLGARRRPVAAPAAGTVAIWTAGGSLIERVQIGSRARGAEMRGETLFVATETGSVAAFDDDHLTPRRPVAVAVPAPPESCTHWSPVVLETPRRRGEGRGAPAGGP